MDGEKKSLIGKEFISVDLKLSFTMTKTAVEGLILIVRAACKLAALCLNSHRSRQQDAGPQRGWRAQGELQRVTELHQRPSILRTRTATAKAWCFPSQRRPANGNDENA